MVALIGGTDGHSNVQHLPLLQVAGVSERQVPNVRGGELDAARTWARSVMRPHVEAVAGEVRTHPSSISDLPQLSSLAPGSVATQAIICAPSLPWPCEWATATVECESEFNPRAVGSEWYDSDGDTILELWYFYGLWQIASRTPPGEGMDWLFDPYLNTIEAHIKYVDGGTGDWPNCPQ